VSQLSANEAKALDTLVLHLGDAGGFGGEEEMAEVRRLVGEDAASINRVNQASLEVLRQLAQDNTAWIQEQRRIYEQSPNYRAVIFGER
jgi:hypothetical protein